MPLAAIALGSNLPGAAGSREANLDGAVQALGDIGTVLAQSRWHDTDPIGYVDQPRFLNGTVLLQTDQTPHDQLASLFRIEACFGRDRSHAMEKGPRTLDLDLLLYGSEVLQLPGLQVPHPSMHERRFVLEPLAEIAPNLLHPVLKKTVADLLQGVS